MVQNKLHYAAHGHTAAEVIYKRADSDKTLMGMTSFNGKYPTLRDAKIAKNYLNENELKILNNLVSGYFDFAEIQAIKKTPMYMRDYIEQLDKIIASTGNELLKNAGRVSHKQAVDKATEEYRKFQAKNLSPVEEEYLNSIKTINAEVKRNK